MPTISNQQGLTAPTAIAAEDAVVLAK